MNDITKKTFLVSCAYSFTLYVSNYVRTYIHTYVYSSCSNQSLVTRMCQPKKIIYICMFNYNNSACVHANILNTTPFE